MDLRGIKNEIKNSEKLYVPKLKEEVIISEVKKENGRVWGIGVTSNGKTIRVDIRDIEPINTNVNVNSPTPFPEEQKEALEANEGKKLEALRLLGRCSPFIKKVLRPELQSAMKKTMMAKYSHSENATVRAAHYANTGLVALRIAEGLFPNDEELAKGIQLCALAHDYGQCPFGHDGEEAARKALDDFNAGSISHNAQGALLLLFRLYPQLQDAINKEPIIETEARERLKKEGEPKQDYQKILKAKKEELKENMDIGLEPELLEQIKLNAEKNKELIDEAIQLIIVSAGNHNGERGTAQIIPDYSKTFKEFMQIIQEIGVDSNANDKLIPHTIADSITKLADQISSIPFDMIDGVRAGIEDEIPNIWVTPVSQILQITEKEAKEKLKGNNKELVTLAFELQDKLIDSVIRCSNSREINMDLDELLYGLNNKIGLRTPNLTEHIIYTSTEEEGIMLDNLFSDLTDILSKELLNKKGLFYPELNEIFRLKSNNPNRASLESELKEKFNGKEELRDFYNYCTGTSSEEYNYHKQIVKKKETEYFRNIIVKELERKQGYRIPRTARGTMEYAIKIAMMSGIEKVSPDKNGNYSDEKIKTMIDNINAYLRSNPIDDIEHLNVTADKTRYDIDKTYTERRKITDDQSIAARMAVNYLCQLNDEQILDMGYKLGLIDELQLEGLFIPYKHCSTKRNGGQGHYSSSASRTAQDYDDALNTGR